MSIIIGLNAHHADSSACIIKNSNLQFAIEEERLNRIKHWAGFPTQSIKECLNQTNTNVSDVTDIAINSNPLSNFTNKIPFFLKNYLFSRKKFEILSTHCNFVLYKSLDSRLETMSFDCCSIKLCPNY